MKFKLDENLGFRCKNQLEIAGHDVHSVLDEGLAGTSDHNLFEVCVIEQRCLITLDLDFTDVTRYEPHLSSGIIVFRLPQNPSLQMLERVLENLLRVLGTESVEGRLWIVEPGRVRVHEDTSSGF